MNVVERLLGPTTVDWIGWTLLHALWQTTLAALVFALASRLSLLRRASGGIRYLAACLALVLTAALPVATSSRLTPPLIDREATGRRPRVEASERDRASTLLPQSWFSERGATSWEPWRIPLSGLTSVWLVGIAFLTTRLGGGWLLVRRLRREGRSIDGPCAELFSRLIARHPVRRPVRLLESSLVQSPMLVGGLRPAILLPSTALKRLSRQQLEALLAHELAHIRRLDDLVNLVQCALEVVWFHLPSVRWISQVVRTEREYCCDDDAVRTSGDRLNYARALAAMEGLRRTPSVFTVAASDGPLLDRVRRLLHQEDEPMLRFPRLGPAITLLLGGLLLCDGSFLSVSRPTIAAPPGQEQRSKTDASSVLGPEVRTIFVPTFRSVSFRRDVQFQLTELVQKEIEKRTPYKVVGRIEEADAILEGTVNLADKNIVVENPFKLPRQLTATMVVTCHWRHNPPRFDERTRESTLVGSALNFTPELGETSANAFYRANQTLATRLVDAMTRPETGRRPMPESTR